MKKLLAVTLTLIMLLIASSCVVSPAVEETYEKTEKVTEAPATEVKTTEAPETEPAATEAPETEPAATEAPETEPAATEAPETEPAATEAPETEQVIPDNAYVFGNIYVIPPEDYTMKDFTGVPSGLKNGVTEGTCFFNFTMIANDEVWDEATATAFVNGLTPGGCNIRGFSTFEVDGVTVVKIDYEWTDQPIIQSLVRIYNEGGMDVSIQFAVLTTIPEGVAEFDGMIETLRIIK